MAAIANINPKVAYFSMEIGLDPSIPTYSGGLGILAGDFLKSAADLGAPVVGVSLLYNRGYFTQNIINGNQVESYQHYDPRQHMIELPQRIKVPIEDRMVSVKAWLYQLKGNQGKSIPILFLDTNGVDNRPWDENITNTLYGGTHPYHRLTQEIVLGIGGVRMLHELNMVPETYHLNEGHGALATLELLNMTGSADKVRERTVFTTHTPVPAGHDKFDYALIKDQVLPEYLNKLPQNVRKFAGETMFNNTLLALNLSRYANAVADKHKEVSRQMFPDYDIQGITNGVHSYTWTSPEFQTLFDKYIPGWRINPAELKSATRIPLTEVVNAHHASKASLVDYVNDVTGKKLSADTPIIGFARRFATYKRGDLVLRVFDDLMRQTGGDMHFIFAGKAHPNDGGGKELIARICDMASKYPNQITFLEGYDMDLAQKLVSGSDAWLNNPMRPHEASGTSGMKAAHNGVPQISTWDGWWCETKGGGWTFGPTSGESNDMVDQIAFKERFPEIYKILSDPKLQARMGIDAIVRNASFFNTHRMFMDYWKQAYNQKEALHKLEQIVSTAAA